MYMCIYTYIYIYMYIYTCICIYVYIYIYIYVYIYIYTHVYMYTHTYAHSALWTFENRPSREYLRNGVRAPVLYGNVREQTGENGFPRRERRSQTPFARKQHLDSFCAIICLGCLHDRYHFMLVLCLCSLCYVFPRNIYIVHYEHIAGQTVFSTWL